MAVMDELAIAFFARLGNHIRGLEGVDAATINGWLGTTCRSVIIEPSLHHGAPLHQRGSVPVGEALIGGDTRRQVNDSVILIRRLDLELGERTQVVLAIEQQHGIDSARDTAGKLELPIMNGEQAWRRASQWVRH